MIRPKGKEVRYYQLRDSAEDPILNRLSNKKKENEPLKKNKLAELMVPLVIIEIEIQALVERCKRTMMEIQLETL